MSEQALLVIRLEKGTVPVNVAKRYETLDGSAQREHQYKVVQAIKKNTLSMGTMRAMPSRSRMKQ
jgi:hypothetical protein